MNSPVPFLPIHEPKQERMMSNLAGIGIFFGGLGIFFLGIGLLWWVSLQDKWKKQENR